MDEKVLEIRVSNVNKENIWDNFKKRIFYLNKIHIKFVIFKNEINIV